ncbi:probable cytosolic iron-sulfur protein assembly protein CIAO1 homolog [Rhopilema esculentum]|uniref:probable cytosolic iron-sulfur protein assembly protein CIAO1 homolog n=1 Tax=Rhopilema esculentum TaxID=499914 RepID=UPI0031DBCEF1
MSTTVKELAVLEGHEERVWNLAWSPSGSLLATCSGDKTIRIWGKEGEKWVCKTILDEGHTRTIRSVIWSPCGNMLASASFDGTVTIWNRSSGEFESIATLEGHENEVKSCSWNSSGSLIATCSRDKSVWIWEVEDEDYECVSVLNRHTQDVKKVLWHPNSEVLASCSYDDTINMYKEDEDDWYCYDTLRGHSSTVWSISFDKTGNRLVSGSDDKTLKIWRSFLPDNQQGIVATGKDPKWKCISTLSGYHTRSVYDVDWSHESGLIASCGADDAMKIFKEDNENTTETSENFVIVANVTKAHSQDINCVKWNPKDSSLLASCSDDCTIKLWKVTSIP